MTDFTQNKITCRWSGEMPPLRLKRLLWLAYNMGNCKAFYSQYLYLMDKYYNPSLVEWYLGHAYLTEAGIQKLKELTDNE